MDSATGERAIEWIHRFRPARVDLTGGAPELCKQFRRLVREARAAGCKVIDRCNLTVLDEPGCEDLPEFLAEHGVEIMASLPCYLRENVDAQRGPGVFERSLAALHRLNQLGYGRSLPLSLVHNPAGADLPPPQRELELEYRRELGERHGLVFSRLLTLANLPLERFGASLRKSARYEGYVELLRKHFNLETLPHLMCLTTLNVDWQGRLYDCDFNQMLDLPVGGSGGPRLWEVSPADLVGRAVLTGEHCFACTAGQGSSCGGALMPGA
jgi:radical SAM/Cys-rich protein